VWPDNVDTVNVFIAASTQWRVGMGGATGLDYAALPAIMKFVGIPKKRQSEVFEGIRLMERAALDEMKRD
jgi:hypothetical protein